MGKKSPKSKKSGTSAPSLSPSHEAHKQQETSNPSSTPLRKTDKTNGGKSASKKLKAKRKQPSTEPASQNQTGSQQPYPAKAFTKLLHAPIVLPSQKRIVHTFVKASPEDKNNRTLIAHWLEFKYPEAAAEKSTRSFAPLSDDDLRELFKPAGTITSIQRLGNSSQQPQPHEEETSNKDTAEDMKYASALLQFSSQKEMSRSLRLRCRNGVFENLDLEPRGYNSK